MKQFSETSSDPYDRHHYRVWLQDGSFKDVETYDEAQRIWYSTNPLSKTIEVNQPKSQEGRKAFDLRVEIFTTSSEAKSELSSKLTVKVRGFPSKMPICRRTCLMHFLKKLITGGVVAGLGLFCDLGRSADAVEGVTFEMECGAAGLVTAKIGKQVPGEGYYFTSLYAPKLGIIKHGLWGYPGAAHFSVEDSDYKFFYGLNTYVFEPNGKKYQCKPNR